MARLSLCMIVRNAADTLGPCLLSIRPWVDELIVVDTGSTDATPRIAAELGARVSHFPWIDSFAAARNESVRLASGEWLFWMDADDVIDEPNGRKLRQLAEGPLDPRVAGYIVQVHCPDARSDGDVTVVDHVKLFRNHPTIRFEHRVHEQILMPIRRLGCDVAWTDIFVVHANADQTPAGRQRKYERDLRLLELDLQDHPEHPFVLFNFGMTYNDMEEHAKAIDWLQRSIAASAGPESQLRKAFALLVHSLSETGREAEALETCERGLERFPGDAELCFRQGMLLHQARRLDESVEAYRCALERGRPRQLTSRCQAITGYKARHNLALVHHDQNDHHNAELQWRLIREELPHYRPSWRFLGETLLRQGKWFSAEVHAEQMAQVEGLAGDALMMKAELALARRNRAEAIALVERCRDEFFGDAELLNARCRLWFALECWREAEQELLELVKRVPGDGAAWHNLGLARYRAGHLWAAASALQESLHVRPDSAATRELLQEVLGQLAGQVELPECHSRHTLDGIKDTFFCSHPQVHSDRNLVSREICRECTRWRDPPPARPRPLPAHDGQLRQSPCAHLGEQTGLRACPSCRGNIRIKEFRCSHPAHQTTTIRECEQCRDYCIDGSPLG